MMNQQIPPEVIENERVIAREMHKASEESQGYGMVIGLINSKLWDLDRTRPAIDANSQIEFISNHNQAYALRDLLDTIEGYRKEGQRLAQLEAKGDIDNGEEVRDRQQRRPRRA